MAVEDKVEIRFKVDRDLAAVFDMLAMGEGKAVTRWCVEKLTRIAIEAQRRANLLAKLPPINPPAPDSQWSDGD